MIQEQIQQKASRILEYISFLRNIQEDCLVRFETDPLYKGALLHYLYLMADSCIALAELVIKQRRLRQPQTYSEAFDILGDNHILEPEFAYQFARIAGFRNFLAHDYEKVDSQQICSNLPNRLEEVESFVRAIMQNLQK